MGAQAVGRAREALRPCGLFVSLGSFWPGLGGRIFAFCVQIPAMGLATVSKILDCAQSSALARGTAMVTVHF